MASDEHKRQAEIVKNVHKMLRINARMFGVSQAWEDHCKQKEVLKQYANAMHELATKHWDSSSAMNTNSRINWVVEQSVKYFMSGGQQIENGKELKRAQNLRNFITPHSETCFGKELTLLDVGSCYNPFKVFPFFKVLPIDLNPACDDVFEADFLTLPVTSSKIEILMNKLSVTFIPKEYFDIVVFSLLLEYMPSSHQRFVCCEKAYCALKSEGLLIIISPDSKHASANSSLMKKWRICLAQIGFTRIVYEKLQHIHCMVFRKNINAVVSQQWAQKAVLHEADSVNVLSDPLQLCEFLKIPQDDTEYPLIKETKQAVRTCEDNFEIVDMFQALPNNDELF